MRWDCQLAVLTALVVCIKHFFIRRRINGRMRYFSNERDVKKGGQLSTLTSPKLWNILSHTSTYKSIYEITGFSDHLYYNFKLFVHVINFLLICSNCCKEKNNNQTIALASGVQFNCLTFRIEADSQIYTWRFNKPNDPVNLFMFNLCYLLNTVHNHCNNS